MMRRDRGDETLIIGAGIGGLAAALRLAGAGRPVHVVEAQAAPGGKMRTMPSAAGPVDAGPTVMTLRPVFEELFAKAGLHMEDYVRTVQEPLLARHWWPDGSILDLHADPEASAAAIRDFAGPAGEADFRAFQRRTRSLFRAFEAPVMQSARPDIAGILRACLSVPGMLPWLLPGRTLWRVLGSSFRDPRLRQLFGRYATYVGGSPFEAPALLALIWQAEAGGVWRVQGGMSALARGLERAATDLGARFTYDSPVDAISRTGDGFDIHLRHGGSLKADRVVYNGDPAALHNGLLGTDMAAAVPRRGVAPRSLSAYVWSFAARPSGRDLGHHNVFFNADYRSEFTDIAAGRMPRDPTLYVCAQDRGTGLLPEGDERFEIIMNAAPHNGTNGAPDTEDEACLKRTFETLHRQGLAFEPLPDRISLTTPAEFAARFPGSDGSLYGLSPKGMLATFRRPVVRSAMPGLYLAGGGVHPGAGLPMAATSGRRAAEAIMSDLASTSRSRRTAMPGGISTGSRTAAPTVSRSSPS